MGLPSAFRGGPAPRLSSEAPRRQDGTRRTIIDIERAAELRVCNRSCYPLHFLRVSSMTWGATRLTLFEGLLDELVALLGNFSDPTRIPIDDDRLAFSLPRAR